MSQRVDKVLEGANGLVAITSLRPPDPGAAEEEAEDGKNNDENAEKAKRQSSERGWQQTTQQEADTCDEAMRVRVNPEETARCEL